MRGYTLLEIMIVVALIATLATLGGMHIHESRVYAEGELAQAKCREYYDAVYLWMMFTKASAPPEDMEILEAAIRPNGRRFARIEPDPWGSAYRLEREGGRRFRIWCNGPDGEEGTIDDIAYEPIETP